MTEPSQVPRRRRGTHLCREKDGRWTLRGIEEVEELPSLPPILDWEESDGEDSGCEPSEVDAD